MARIEENGTLAAHSRADRPSRRDFGSPVSTRNLPITPQKVGRPLNHAVADIKHIRYKLDFDRISCYNSAFSLSSFPVVSLIIAECRSTSLARADS